MILSVPARVPASRRRDEIDQPTTYEPYQVFAVDAAVALKLPPRLPPVDRQQGRVSLRGQSLGRTLPTLGERPGCSVPPD